jgi:hypothetical protein
MAWEVIEKYSDGEKDRVYATCLSTDTKPATGIAAGSIAKERDTKKAWEFSELDTNPATSDGWWEA